MKRRIGAVALLLSVILSLFGGVNVYAADTTDISEYLTQGEYWGFDEYINVEQYAINAGKSGYNSMQIIAIDVPEISRREDEYGNVSYSWAMGMLIYNPLLEPVDYDPLVNTIGSARIQDYDDSSTATYLVHLGEGYCCDGQTSETFTNLMFFQCYAKGSVNEDSISTDVQKYNVESVQVLGNSFTVNRTLVNGDIGNTLPYTAPVDDLKAFKGKTREEILDEFPFGTGIERSVAFFYENHYGRDDYSLYLYMYYPYRHALTDSITVYMYMNGSYIPCKFYLKAQDSTLYKYKYSPTEDFEAYYENDTVRNYYIGKITVYGEFGEKNVFPEVHYQFSDNAISDDVANFVYKMDSFQFPTSTPNEDGSIPEYLIEIDSLEYEGVDFSDSAIVEKGEYVYQLTANTYPYQTVSSFYVNSDFPIYGTPTCTVSVYDISSGVSEFVCTRTVTGSFSHSEEPETAAVSLLSSSGGFNIRSSNSEEIKLDVGHTYYRLDSSVNGNGFYQTLTSVYFSVPYEYMEMEDVFSYNDRYVSAVEFEYDTAFMTPALVYYIPEAQASLKEQLLEARGSKVANTVTSTLDYNTSLDGLDTWYETHILIGDDNVGNILPHLIYADKVYDTYEYVYFLDKSIGEYDKFAYVISSEELMQQIEERQSYDGELTHYKDILRFGEEKNLYNYESATFETMKEDFGFWSALWFKFLGTEQQFVESTLNIPVLQTLDRNECEEALEMSYVDFCAKYYVAESDYEKVIDRIETALFNDEAFVLMRFDTYDYYADYMYVDVEQCDGFIFQDKVYKDFDVLSMHLTNTFNTEVYSVAMTPITFVQGATTPDPILKEEIITPGEAIGGAVENVKDFLSGDKDIDFDIGKILSIVAVVILLLIFWKPIFSFFRWIIKGIANLFGKIKEWISERKK